MAICSTIIGQPYQKAWTDVEIMKGPVQCVSRYSEYAMAISINTQAKYKNLALTPQGWNAGLTTSICVKEATAIVLPSSFLPNKSAELMSVKRSNDCQVRLLPIRIDIQCPLSV